MNLEIDDPLFYRLTFDRLLRRTLLVMGRGAGAILGICLIVLLPGLVLSLLSTVGALGEELPVQLVGLFVQLVLAPLATGALVYSVFRLLRAKPLPPVSRSLSLAGGSLVKLVIASVLAAILTGLGFLFCVIPGFVVITGLLLTAPVIMVERVGPVEALNRSWELSEGYRWPIFGVLGLIWFLQIGLSLALGATLGAAGLVTPAFLAAAEVPGNLLWTALSATTAGVAYHDLRVVKDELGEDELLAVFE